jgi:lipopolysaccharide export system protein LptA
MIGITKYLKNVARFIGGCLLIGHLHLACALKTDEFQPTKLSSDKADFNEVTQEYILTGNVTIKKGSILVTGAKAVVITDPEGYQKITVIGDTDNVAQFSQQLDKPTPEFIDGEGDLIFYEAKFDQLLLSGHAYTVRRSGDRKKDQLIADEIHYDLYTEEYRAVSKTDQKLTRSVLSPRQETSLKLTNAPLTNTPTKQ